MARSFNSNFNTERAKRGTAPVNLLKIGFSTPVYISDRDVTPSGGSAHSGLVKAWGFIDTAAQSTPGAGLLGRIEIADLRLTIINSESSPFSANFATADPLQGVDVELYQWFTGLVDADKELIFKGVVWGQPEYDLYECRLTVRGIWYKYDIVIGEDMIISADDFPSADPDDIGKMQNICIGSLENVPCRSVESGGVDNLYDDITASDTSIELSDATEMASSGTIGIDAEEITYTGKSGNTLTGCTRGANSTDAVSHSEGAGVWQILTRFVYQVAGHPVQSIGDVYVDGVRVTSIATTYTGQTGDELTGYEDMAVVTVPDRITRQQLVDLIVSDTITVNDAISVIDTIGVSDTIDVSDAIAVVDSIGVSDSISVSDDIAVTVGGSQKELYPNANSSSYTTNPTNAYNGNEDDYAQVYHASFSSYLTLTFPSTSYGTITAQYFYAVVSASVAGDITVKDTDGSTLGTITAGTSKAEIRFSSAKTSWSLGIKFECGGGENVNVYEVRKVVEYTASTTKTGSASKSGTVSKTGSASKSGTVTKTGSATITGSATKDGTVTKSGTVTLSGNSVADVQIGAQVTVDMDGYQDDGSGTYTGTPNALIERPDHVFKLLWCVFLGAPAADTDFSAAGTFYSTNSYTFGLLIDTPIQAETLFMRLALQCRSRFLVTPQGKARLVVRETGRSSVQSIPKNEIRRDSVSVSHSHTDDLVNTFTVYYDRDNRLDAGNSESYLANKLKTDSTSVTRYGRRDYTARRDVLLFDAVRNATMADHVASFILAWHCLVRKMPKCGVFLDNCQAEPGDCIDITHDLDSMSSKAVEVVKITWRLGSARRQQIDTLDLVTIEV